ncbi:MAG: group 1 truncated hemoglobin [Myxococcota bacterium]
MAETDFERIGGEEKLRTIIDVFVDRVFDDLMIGFHFRGAKRKRVKRFEYEHAAEHLGGPVSYGGRALREAHAAHRIMGGHFDRRSQILREVLDAHEVNSDIRDRWLDHVQSLRGHITGDGRGECVAEAPNLG